MTARLQAPRWGRGAPAGRCDAVDRLGRDAGYSLHRQAASIHSAYASIQMATGAVLVAMGVLVVTGELFRLNVEAQQFLDRFGLNFFQDV